MIDFVGRKRWFFLISWILVIVGIAALIISQIQFGAPLRLGTDFAGGTSMTLQFEPAVEQGQLREEMSRLGRRSIIARVDIPRGTKLTGDMLIVKRPGYGIQPKFLDTVIGREVKRDIERDDIITWEMV